MQSRQSAQDGIASQNAADPYKVNSLILKPNTDPVAGTVRWDPLRSVWNGTILIAAVTFAPIYATWDAFLLFLFLSAVTLCTGHSVGYHRRLVHRSFKCPKWVERTLVWMGAAVGMGGPLWTIRTHDTRDWAQPGEDKIAEVMLTQTKAGSIILCHELNRQTVDCLGRVLDQLLERKHQFVPVTAFL